MAELTYEYDDQGMDILVDNGTDFVGARMVRWNPDREFKPDIRRYYVKEGEILPGKGVGMSEDAFEEMVTKAAEFGWGDFSAICTSRYEQDKEDFIEAVAVATFEDRANFCPALLAAYKSMQHDEDNKPKDAKSLLDQIFDKEAS